MSNRTAIACTLAVLLLIEGIVYLVTPRIVTCRGCDRRFHPWHFSHDEIQLGMLRSARDGSWMAMSFLDVSGDLALFHQRLESFETVLPDDAMQCPDCPDELIVDYPDGWWSDTWYEQ